MTDTLTINAVPLTQEAFAPYGDVVEMRGDNPETMNQGWGVRYNDLADVDILDNDGEVKISLVRMQPEDAPVPLRLVERHSLGSQIFMPLSNNPFIVVVAPAGDVPSRDEIKVFVTNGQQGINYHKGIWHHPMIALEGVTDFITIDRKGPGNNCDEAEILGGPVKVAVP